MSQAGFKSSGSGAAPVETLTGNSGGAVSPSGGGNINVIGTGNVTVTGNPGTSTLTIAVSGGVSSSTTYVDTTPYTILTSDENILVDTATIGAPSSMLLPDSPATDGQIWTVKDWSGLAAASPITVSTVSSLSIIDGASAYVLANSYESVSFVWSLSENTYSVISQVDPAFISLPPSSTSTGYVAINGVPALQTSGSNNTFVGNSGNFTLSGSDNSAMGFDSMAALTTGAYNVGIGNYSLRDIQDGQVNTALGYQCMASLVSGGSNCSVGENGFLQLTDGNFNLGMGQFSGANYVSTESSNIVFNHGGVAAESNTLRIGGGTGTGNQQLAAAYISGIDNVNLNVANVVTEASDQLGTAVLTPGSGISISTGTNTITISSSGVGGMNYTNVGSSPYVVLTTDNYISVDCSSSPIELQFPNAATLSQTFVIKDRTGSCATNNITITTVGGTVRIDGATSVAMNSNFESLNLIGNGAFYEVW